ncbi:prevent-host-death family protein [Glycocaulis alkaliphilus]|uniref:Antitoxin n=2 Tax=Glycocaulis TaxID=1433402 RepID=A0A3T0EBT2_9PROT|nr:type II toxin-antitoxin system prevent-host-death family antitoxin [Glycocaulis alkaliphilus]AZU04656.1 prevent-host-death family protein [Glycocaulis alkaliphilus]GGB68764.1 hypothetical protein GCM10007417_05700 [Glycocaulis alkaliphilus]
MFHMDTILTFSQARASLKALMERVTGNKAPAIITRQGGEPVVMVPLSEWEAIQETNYLLKSPANAARLAASIAAADKGEAVRHSADELAALLDR